MRYNKLIIGIPVAAAATWMAVGYSGLSQDKSSTTIQHLDFVTGELKMLMPHLEFDAVRFHIDNQGKPCPIEVFLEDWKDGKAVDSKSLRNEVIDKEDVTFSWRSLGEGEEPLGYRVILACRPAPRLMNGIKVSSGYSTLSHVWQPSTKGVFLSTSQRDPLDLRKKGTIYLWTVAVHKRATPIRVGDSVETTAKACEQALVLKIVAKE